jgi:hypothetical protein
MTELHKGQNNMPPYFDLGGIKIQMGIAYKMFDKASLEV